MVDKKAAGGLVLYVDDEAPLRHIVQRYLEAEGLRVLLAADGREGLDVARSQQPDLILADWMMPNMDGISLCREVRAADDLKSTYVVMLTAKKGVENAIEALNAGADDYLTKPFQREELVARIRAGLRVRDLQRQVLRMQGDLYRAEKMASLGTMAGGIAHEFNNLFGAIVGYCELALEQNAPRMTQKALRVTLESANRATAITRNLLGFARQQKAERGPVSLKECADRIMVLMEAALRKRGIAVTMDEEEVPPVRADAAQIQQVLFNVIQNAQHAMEHGGTLAIAVGPAPREGYGRIQISDTGIGIPKEHLQRIMEPFFTTKGAYGHGSGQGTGLGLSVAHGIVESHGGTITIQSEPGHGTTAEVVLPLVTMEEMERDKSAAKAETPRLDEHLALRPLTILAVDDEEAIREVLLAMLTRLGHAVDVASSARQAMALFKKRRYDVILTDVIMPGQDGWDLLKEVRAIQPEMPVIFITGSVGKETLDRTKAEGALGCIYKPFHIEEIRKVLAEFVRQHWAKPLRLRLTPNLNANTCSEIAKMVLGKLEREKRDLEIDMASVGYLPSCAIGLIMTLYSRVTESGATLTLCNVGENPFESLELMGLVSGKLEHLKVERRTYDGQVGDDSLGDELESRQ